MGMNRTARYWAPAIVVALVAAALAVPANAAATSATPPAPPRPARGQFRRDHAPGPHRGDPGGRRLRRPRHGRARVRPLDGKPLYDRHIETRLRPASNEKLVTSATALAKWGAAHRFKTELLTTGTSTAPAPTMGCSTSRVSAIRASRPAPTSRGSST